MLNYTPPLFHTNEDRQRLSQLNASDASDRYTSSDDSERICNKKVKADKLAAAKASTTDLAVIAPPSDESQPSSVSL